MTQNKPKKAILNGICGFVLIAVIGICIGKYLHLSEYAREISNQYISPDIHEITAEKLDSSYETIEVEEGSVIYKITMHITNRMKTMQCTDDIYLSYRRENGRYCRAYSMREFQPQSFYDNRYMVPEGEEGIKIDYVEVPIGEKFVMLHVTAYGEETNSEAIKIALEE